MRQLILRDNVGGRWGGPSGAHRQIQAAIRACTRGLADIKKIPAPQGGKHGSPADLIRAIDEIFKANGLPPGATEGRYEDQGSYPKFMAKLSQYVPEIGNTESSGAMAKRIQRARLDN